MTEPNNSESSREPIPQAVGDSERIAKLEALGLTVRPKAAPVSIEEIRRIRPAAPGARLLEALLEERESGR